MEPTLTDVDERLLEAVRDNGDWITRSQLDEKLGGLSPYHISRLDRMIALGLIKQDYRIRGIAQKVYLYRAS